MVLLSILSVFISSGNATCIDACISHSQYPNDCGQYPTQKEACQTVHQRCLNQCSVVEVTASNVEQTLFSDVQIGGVEAAMKSCPDQVMALTRLHIPELRACHVASLNEYPEVSGRLILDVDMENGSVFRVQIRDNKTADNALGHCVMEEVQTWRTAIKCTDLIAITLDFQPMTEAYAKGDMDSDGVSNYQDVFPRDSKESIDSDGDGVGDNSDQFPNDMEESTDEDNSGVGDNTEKNEKIEGELAAIDKDFQLLQELSDEKREWQKNAYKDIKTSLNGQEVIYRANAPLKKEWEELIDQRVAMKESRNTRKMSKYLEKLAGVAERLKAGHTIVVTDEQYAEIPIEDRSRKVYLYPPKEVASEMFSIHKEVSARITWWESESTEIGFRVEAGTNSGAALHFNSGSKLSRDYELFVGTSWLTPEAMFSVEILPWALNRSDVLCRVSSDLDLNPSVGLAMRYEFRNFWSITGTYDVSLLDSTEALPGLSIGYKRIKKF